MEAVVLLLFAGILVGCMVLGVDLIVALFLGLALFLGYGLIKGHRPAALAAMCGKGVKTVGNVMAAFVLIGALTAMWRASGCIPAIVSYASGLVSPRVFLPVAFLLCSLVSFLLGTAFGTSASMGVILMSMARAMGVPLAAAGGAVLAGAYFGDRCSPVSTSALLVSTLTKTDLHKNIRAMFRSAVVPLVLALAVWFALGAGTGTGDTPAAGEIFRKGFVVSPVCLLPALCILVPAMLRCDVKLTILIGALSAVPVAVFVQGVSPARLLPMCWSGYRTEVAELAAMVNGGGLQSMLRAGVIVCVASCYSGIFNGTGMLDFLERPVRRFAARFGSFATVLGVSAVTGMVACNQTLTIMLTERLTEGVAKDKEELALALEDTAVVISPLIPWSIAGTVSLAAAGAPMQSILFACYLYFIPLWRLVSETVKRKKRTR